MNITEACQTVREWAVIFISDGRPHPTPGNLTLAAATVKAYLEREKADGKPIVELDIPDHLLMSREGIRWVMPFTLSVESIESGKRRKELG